MNSGRRERALVLLSGGIDSIVSLAVAARIMDIRLALFINYGQRAVEPERQAVLGVVNYYGVPLREIDLPWLEQLLPREMRSGEPGTADGGLDAVWVPNRNGVLINCAAAIAEASGYRYVVTGFNSEEAEEFPDNRREFVSRINRSLLLSTRNGVTVVSFTQNMSKTEILIRGQELSAPLSVAWSCYGAGERMCGACASCRKLRAAHAAVPADRRPRIDLLGAERGQR